MKKLRVIPFWIVLAAAAAQMPPTRDPLIPAGQTHLLTPHTWAIEDRDTTPGVPNIGFVVGRTGALVIDTGMGARNGAVVLSEAQKLAPGRQIYLVTTHVHPEHDLGAGAFPPSTKMIRSKDEEREIGKNGLAMRDMFMSRGGINQQLLQGATFRKADIEFDKEYTLDLGGVTARIIAVGPNHTIGDTVIFVPAERVLFSGDVAMKGGPAFVGPDSSLKHWLVALDMLNALHPAIVVPSHGPIGDAGYITHYQALMTDIRDRVAALKHQGKSLEKTTATVTAELGTKYGDPNRLRGAIQAAYSEAS